MNNSNWYISATGNGLSATVGGFSIVGLAQAISLIATMIGHPVSQDIVSSGIVTIVTAVGSIYAAFGILRKAYFWSLSVFNK